MRGRKLGLCHQLCQSKQSAELAGKRLELLREIGPGLRRLAIIANADNPDAASDVRQFEAAAGALAGAYAE